MLLLALSAAVVFWAGLSLGGQTAGRDDTERVAIEAFTETYRHINDEFVGESDPGQLLEGAICGMFETLDDPYSVCLGSSEFESRFEDISGEFGGIGAVMNTEDAEGVACDLIGPVCGLRVVEVLDGAPALEAGLLADDVVTAVDGEPLEGLTISDSVLLIRGPRGSDVTLTLERDGESLELEVQRDTIVTKDVRSALLADDQIGYLRIDSFSSNAADDFEAELKRFLEAGVERFVVDLRDDPGGFVDAAVRISSEFLGDGPVLWEEDAAGNQVSIDVEGGGLATRDDLQIVVLVNNGTASASEIVAGALQDAGRAQLVGTPTFGKGTVQEWTQLPGENGGFRLSVAKWLTRGKTWVDGMGLIPDAPVGGGGTRYQAGDAAADPDEDEQLRYAIGVLLGETQPALASPAPSAQPEGSTSD
jgi:carboxyl-terminal processing protease